jgi:hypothetical protein
MARPIKIGLDYFPLDVNIDDSIELIEAEHGLQGFAIIIKLWQKIYSNGYFIKWDNDTSLLFSKRINTELNTINSVINSCFLREIFDEKLFKKYKIITSSGVQKRFLLASSQSKRKSILFIKEYMLVNSELTNVITELIEVNSEFSTQSKEEERKEEESKINKIDFEIFWGLYDKKIETNKCEKKWNKLSFEIQNKILDYLPKYKHSIPDKKYRKNPDTFLNNECWNDEIIETQNNNYQNKNNQKSHLQELTEINRLADLQIDEMYGK